MNAKLIFLAATAALVLATTVSAAALDVIRGTDGPDNLNGTAGADLIYGRGGNDNIRAHDGNDVVYAGRGNDVVRGGPGNDAIYAGQGNDVTWAGAGADVQSGERQSAGYPRLRAGLRRRVRDRARPRQVPWLRAGHPTHRGTGSRAGCGKRRQRVVGVLRSGPAMRGPIRPLWARG